MARAIALLRAGVFQIFVNYLDKIGTPTTKLFRRSQLPVFGLEDPYAFLPRHQVFAFLFEAARRDGILIQFAFRIPTFTTLIFQSHT